MNIKTDRACVALSHLDPSCDRNTWVKYGMCLKHEFGDAGFDLWDEWSSRSEKYRASDARSTWKSIKADGKRTIATLFYDAKQAGWKDDAKHKKPTKAEIEARKAAAAARAEQAAKEEAEQHEKSADWAQRLWSEAQPCESHPYLERKGVASYGLRVGPWERINADTGEIEVVAKNALLVPIQDRQRKVWGLQGIFVDPNSKKLYLKGCAKRGNFFAIGKPQKRDGRLVFILAEGYATGASVHAATGHMVLVCFDVENLMAVAQSLRERQPGAFIVFAADNDTQTDGNPGVTKAKAASKAVGGLVAVPPPGDFNDLQVAEGLEAIALCIKGAFESQFEEESPNMGVWTDYKSSSLIEQSIGGQVMLPSQDATQDSVAQVFKAHYDGRLLFANGFDCWFKWDGTRWRREETGLALDLIRTLARKMNVEGKSAPSTANFCKGVETFAKVDRAFATEASVFDTDNYLLNTPAGTFDLRTNVMRPHDPLDRITKTTAVAPCAQGGELFLKFLEEITGGDASLVRFLQISLGACLSGAIEGHWMLFWNGSGRNGKNTLGDLVMDVMGDYAKKIPSSTLMSKLHEDHPTEIANLQGVRLAVSSEVEDGAHWHEARINELTGDQALTARFMRGNFFEFKRTHKHLIYGNHRPQLRNVTDALKARIKIVPFKQSFAGREDPTLATKLREEAGFVLSWLIEGHAAWMASGCKLPTCEAIEDESRDYFEAQSTVEAWIRECVTLVGDDGRGARAWPTAGALYKAYKAWKEARGEQPVSQSRWGETMGKKFKRQTSNGVRYIGAELLPI